MVVRGRVTGVVTRVVVRRRVVVTGVVAWVVVRWTVVVRRRVVVTGVVVRRRVVVTGVVVRRWVVLGSLGRLHLHFRQHLGGPGEHCLRLGVK